MNTISQEQTREGHSNNMFGKKNLVCNYCHEHFTMSFFRYHYLKLRFGRVTCPYCQRPLSVDPVEYEA